MPLFAPVLPVDRQETNGSEGEGVCVMPGTPAVVKIIV